MKSSGSLKFPGQPQRTGIETDKAAIRNDLVNSSFGWSVIAAVKHNQTLQLRGSVKSVRDEGCRDGAEGLDDVRIRELFGQFLARGG